LCFCSTRLTPNVEPTFASTELRDLHPAQIEVLENITNVRGTAIDGDMEAFCLFFDQLLPCVAGRKVWTPRERAARVITEAKKIVSVIDEAFTILALENYWDRWHEKGIAKWTDSRQGNYQYMGWADDAYTRFDVLCNRIREQRQTTANKQLELNYLARARNRLAGGAEQARINSGLGGRGVEVYNELESSDDED
jgi:hypothetical protein